MLPRLYAIADAAVLRRRGVGLREFAVELRAAGVRLVQWRDKVGSPQEVLAGAAVLRTVFGEPTSQVRDVGHPILVMNDRVDLAVLAGFDGVHVGQGDLLPEDVRRVVTAGDSEAALEQATHPSQGREGWATQTCGGGTQTYIGATPIAGGANRIGSAKYFVVGISTHTEEQVRVAGLSGADYVAVGPVFATGTKVDAEAVIGLEGVRRARALTKKPMVAIGGITRANARSVMDAGADSVAVISGLFGVEGEQVGRVVEDFLRVLG